MRTLLSLLALLAVAPAGAALADDDCRAPRAEWQPRDAVVRLAQANGWMPGRIDIDDGCYEFDATDAQGQRFEVTVHPGTLAVIEVERDDHDGHDRRRPTAATVPAPPANGLFGTGAPVRVQVN